MKETGLICTAESVRAILAGRKTQTRRVMKPQPTNKQIRTWLKYPNLAKFDPRLPKCPYGQVGDRLYMKETFWYCCDGCKIPLYKANGVDLGPRMGHIGGVSYVRKNASWKSPRFMPKWAARPWRGEITGIRVEWVQEISIEDCRAEGMKDDYGRYPVHDMCPDYNPMIPKIDYEALWDSLHATPQPANRNPYTNEKELCKVAYPWDDVREETIINRKTSRFHGCKVYISAIRSTGFWNLRNANENLGYRI